MMTEMKEKTQYEKKDLLFGYIKKMKDTTRFRMTERNGIIYFFDQRTSDIVEISDSLSELVTINTADEYNMVLRRLSQEEIMDNTDFLSAVLDIPDTPVQCTRSRSEISVLKLNAGSKCNLSCAYCFRDKGENRLIEDGGLVYKAIDGMVNDFGRDARSYTVCFNLASEPLLYPGLMNDIHDYLKKTEARTGKRMELFFITNGTILSPPLIKTIKRIRKNRPVSISIDGPKEVHDALRGYPGGKGSYEVITANIQSFRKKGLPISAESVITARHPYPLDILRHLSGLGFESVNMKPVRRGTPYSFDEKSIGALKTGYDEYFTFLEEALLDEDYFVLKLLCKDYAIRPLWRMLFNHKINLRCGWGVNQISMDHRGDFYPCDSVMGMEAYRTGNVRDGIDWNRYHADLACERRGECDRCWARHICGGTCYVNGIIGNNDMLAVDPVECTLTKHLIESNLSLICDLLHAGADIEAIKEVLKANLKEIYLL